MRDLLAGIEKLGGHGILVGQQLVATIKQAGTALSQLTVPTLILMGSEDHDFANPEQEAKALVSAMPAGRGRYEMLPGAGHYGQAQVPELVAEKMIAFLNAND
ncbi:alpha/beta fold hydrolase [Furfurilactobacillus sp. WILCCON 0119]